MAAPVKNLPAWAILLLILLVLITGGSVIYFGLISGSNKTDYVVVSGNGGDVGRTRTRPWGGMRPPTDMGPVQLMQNGTGLQIRIADASVWAILADTPRVSYYFTIPADQMEVLRGARKALTDPDSMKALGLDAAKSKAFTSAFAGTVWPVVASAETAKPILELAERWKNASATDRTALGEELVKLVEGQSKPLSQKCSDAIAARMKFVETNLAAEQVAKLRELSRTRTPR